MQEKKQKNLFDLVILSSCFLCIGYKEVSFCCQIQSKRLKEVIGHFVTASAQHYGIASYKTYQGNSRPIVCRSFEPGGVVRKQLYCPPLCVEGMINYLTTGWRHASPAFFLFLATFNNVTVFFVF